MLIDAVRNFVSRFVNLNDEEFSLFSQTLEFREFDKRKPLTREGEIENYLNFIVSGLARKYFYRNKEEMVTQIAKENEVISVYNSFLSGTPSTYVIETIEPTTFVSISKQNVENLYISNPKMERLGRLIVTQQFLNKESWEYDRMRLNSHERFIHFIKENPDLLQRVPQKYLASYLNIKPETFSRLKHLLKRKR
ncbi:MAG TPA: Crp/Fnr family transcriptional regulator [Puia sp.]|jgi:CRP-like cAMP-binding protein|nr:Crp/Fnr family transcriptional regulator [Puia sp.]